MRRTGLPLLVAAVALNVVAVTAYKLNGPKWGTRQVPYYVNPANSDASESAALAAIQAGALAWSAQSNADFSWYYMGRTTGSAATKNGKNEIFFRNESDGGVVARTYWWYDSSNRLVDADVIFYDGGWTFYGGSSGCSSGMYIEDITVHELGHALGLGHSADPDATMYPSVGRCSTGFRTLHADDLAGVEALYPPTSSNSAPSVSISAPGNNTSFTEGAAIGFTGSATDKEDGNLSSKMIWSSSRDGQIGTGASFSRALSAGTHTVTAAAADTSGQTSSRQISVIVNSTEPANTAPTVSISAPSNNTSVAYGTTLTFSGSASDAEDGSLTSKLVWSSNLDGPLGMGGSVSRALTVGTHAVRAAVSDSDGASSTRQITVYVVAPPPLPPTGLTLSAKGYKKKGVQYADLKWAGASSTKVDIYRDGVRVANTANDGAHTDNINHRGGGSYTYKLCEAGTTTCSSSVVVRF
jgi:hypothetical protein